MINEQLEIAFVFDGLGMGGIERVGIDYIRLFVNAGYKVTVYNLHPSENRMVTKLPDHVEYIEVQLDKKLCPEIYSYGIQKYWWGKYAYPILHMLFSIVLKMKKVFFKKRKYDVAIAFSGHINDLTFVTEKFILAKQKIVWCHGTLLSYLAICDAYSILYQKVDTIVTLSDVGEGNVYSGKKYLYEKTIKKIYNPSFILERKVDAEFCKRLYEKYQDYVLMIARFSAPKDHITAINAIKNLKERGIDKKIVFLGDGPELEKIKQYAINCDIDKNCVFEGNVFNTQDYIYASYINLLSSVSEGLPTVIIEAMAFGKPCIMTNCDGGEVSEQGKYCILTKIKDEIAMADKIELLYKNKDIYNTYKKLSKERFKAFDAKNTFEEINKLLKN